MKRTKMVCTLGPATSTKEKMEALVDAGMNVARLNFSHGDHEEHRDRMTKIKEIRQEKNVPVALMLDTKGPEIRTGVLKEGKVTVNKGDELTITTQQIEGDIHRISVSYEGLADDVVVGNTILIDDGLVGLTVQSIEGTEIHCTVENEGIIGSRKGVNVPNVAIKLPGLTEKDEADIIFGIKQGIDFVAASFVRKTQDVIAIRKVLENNGGGDVQIISKIESNEGVQNIDKIIAVSDGIMVARGDLGVEIPAEEVPLVQKEIIRKCNELGKPVITATQMLDSMIRNPRPTRAEVADVANAVFDGTDAVMLSGETAAGDYPVEAVKTMANIVERVEKSPSYEHSRKAKHGEITITNAVGDSAVFIANSLNARAIIAASSSGYTPRMLAKYRPKCPIFAVTNKFKTVTRLALTWGVYCFYMKELFDVDEMVMAVLNEATEKGWVKTGDLTVVAAGLPLGVQGSTNMLKIHTVGNAILNGTGIGSGAVTGYARLVNDHNLDEFGEGDIAVVKMVTSNLQCVLHKAGAIISESNGQNTEVALAAGHYNIPAIVGVDKACEILTNGKVISVDADRGMIYQGKVNF